MRLKLVAWELEESFTWEESFFEDSFIPQVEQNDGFHDPYELGDPFCDIIYNVEDEVSLMATIIDGINSSTFLLVSSIKEEKL